MLSFVFKIYFILTFISKIKSDVCPIPPVEKEFDLTKVSFQALNGLFSYISQPINLFLVYWKLV
jgi:hypothetical protein